MKGRIVVCQGCDGQLEEGDSFVDGGQHFHEECHGPGIIDPVCSCCYRIWCICDEVAS